MSSRLRHLALAVAGLALLSGLLALFRVFEAENTERLQSVAAEEATLRARVAERFRASFEAELAAAEVRMQRAVEDPLASDDGLALWDGDRHLLPRSPNCKAGGDHRAAKAFAAVASGRAVSLPELYSNEANGRARAERLTTLTVAVAAADALRIEVAFRALLDHRLRFVMEPALELGGFAGAVDLLMRGARPRADLLRSVLVTGLSATDGGHLPGLQAAVLNARESLTCTDFDDLVQQIVRLTNAAGLSDAEFRARAANKGVSFRRPHVAAPTLFQRMHDTYFLRPDEKDPTRLMGVRVDLASAERRKYATDGLTQPFEYTPPGAPGRSARGADVSPNVEFPELAAAAARAEERFRLKSALLAACALMGAALLVVAGLWQRKRQQLVELKEDFVATVSHELRTPLAAIRLMAETLERRFAGEARARDYPTRIVQQTDGLTALVENILSFNRIHRGKVTLARTETRVGDVLEAAATVLRRTAPTSAHIELEGALDERLTVDAEWLALLLVNLGRNALTYNDRDPAHVRFEVVLADSQTLLFNVTDNGRGIPEADRRRVFEAWVRGKGRTERGGTGLGLALCLRIARLHGGGVILRSTSAEGSCFEVRLPRR